MFTVPSSDCDLASTGVRYDIGMAPEGWVLAGTLDGVPAYPTLDTQICGVAHGDRMCAALVAAGVGRVVVVWNDLAQPPPRFDIAHDAPVGDPRDRVVVMRGDRIVDPALVVWALAAHRDGDLTRLDGDHDGVFVTDRARGRHLVMAMRAPGGLARVARACVTVAAPPGGFTLRASGSRSLLAAEQHVWCQRAGGARTHALSRRAERTAAPTGMPNFGSSSPRAAVQIGDGPPRAR